MSTDEFDRRSPSERPPGALASAKSALETAVDLFDELCALADDYVTDGGRPKLADLRRRRAALQPRLAKRRENQAKPRGEKT